MACVHLLIIFGDNAAENNDTKKQMLRMENELGMSPRTAYYLLNFLTSLHKKADLA